ncbi:hypothetical protein [Nitrosospira sp. Is2]|uniref:hypothetical protein n=1 Tax=Nitrosospira sp. Is2 TaxID=3080532 RepID=UPI0029546826|nr:hypothetical protein [Nitrosospira sp. Is2]WON74109.1 hypothetical protein R5L00_01055 [Nitrosospira sp. Is2]
MHLFSQRRGLSCGWFVLAALSGQAMGQEVLREVNVSTTRVKEPLIEKESLKWTPRPSSDAAEFL